MHAANAAPTTTPAPMTIPARFQLLVTVEGDDATALAAALAAAADAGDLDQALLNLFRQHTAGSTAGSTADAKIGRAALWSLDDAEQPSATAGGAL